MLQYINFISPIWQHKCAIQVYRKWHCGPPKDILLGQWPLGLNGLYTYPIHAERSITHNRLKRRMQASLWGSTAVTDDFFTASCVSVRSISLLASGNR